MAYCHHKTFLVKTEFEDELLMETNDIWQQKPMHKPHLDVGSKEKHTEGHQ